MANLTFTSNLEPPVTISDGSLQPLALLSGTPLTAYVNSDASFIPSMDTTVGFPHTGTQCLKMSSATSTGATRFSELIMYMPPEVATQYFVRCWRYLPTNFRVNAGDFDNFLTFLNTEGLYYPYADLLLENSGSVFHVRCVDASLVEHELCWTPITNILPAGLPKGRWFKQEFFVNRSATGSIKLWIDGVEVPLTIPVGGLNLVGAGTPFIIPASIRHGGSDTLVPIEEWVDDIEFYDDVPTAGTASLTINSSPITNIQAIIDGAQTINTPNTVSLPTGAHTVAVPAQVVA